MSQENVEAFKRATEAANRREIEAALEEGPRAGVAPVDSDVPRGRSHGA